MNERIRELATEAEDYADGIVDKGGEFHETYTKKFAELIVKECINEIHVADVGNLQGKGYYLDKVAEHIEKYFGVEE